MVDSYPITGILKDVDGVTNFNNATVRIIDVTLGEYIEGNTESDGSFSVDIQNLTSDYSNNDKLQVVIYDSNKVKSTEFRHTVDTGLSGYDTGTLYLHWTKPIMGESRLFAGIFSNKNDSNEYTIDLYDRTNDNKIISVDVNVNNSLSLNFGFTGLSFPGGICIIRESDTANTVEVQLVVK